MNKTIAIIEDEQDIRELVALHLKKENFVIKEFSDATSFYKYLNSEIPGLIILDLMLPDIDGLEICKYLKKKEEYESIPVIMLTAKGGETDKIVGLELGADDYITKPFSPKELVARVKAVLRRYETKKTSGIVQVSDLFTIDPDKFEVLVGGKKIELTTSEFKILELLVTKKGVVYSRDKILDHLWGRDKTVIDRTVDVHVKNLREKLGEVGRRHIKNVRGIGYKFEE
jgi:DNA-binding response OmpR family regulator